MSVRDGRVVASHGRDASVVDESGRPVHCRLQARRLAVVCGDRVRWTPASTEGGAGVIVEVLPRASLLSRITARGAPEPVAANVTQLVAVVAPAPAPLQAGMGRVATIVPVPPSASAGGSAAGPSRRVGIRMDSGVVQYVDTDAQGLSIGERLEITDDGYMKRLGG